MVLGPALSSFLTPLENVAGGGFQNLMIDGETLGCFLRIVSYCCVVSDARIIIAVRHGAKTRQPCTKYHRTYEDSLKGRKS